MSEKLVPKRQYTDEFKVEAIRLAESVGQHEAARTLGVPAATVGNWSRRSRSSKDIGEVDGREVKNTRSTRPINELEAENSRLRKELASAKHDIEMLRKATEYFVKGSREVRMDRRAPRQYSGTRLCRILKVSRSGYCQWRNREPSQRARPAPRSIGRWRRFIAPVAGATARIVRQLKTQG
ncbi:IS3 family transposase ISBvi3 [Paraburkholderia haematera]|uniref:IS3 family transposase ISBvi3 n=1 Tax=Paraburkholderia haematera TaxID=2793077 RepID=A0ABM8S8I9_9BURK|nr:IS3 family transposase ISBvi3 [Paraburkholderia haematera]